MDLGDGISKIVGCLLLSLGSHIQAQVPLPIDRSNSWEAEQQRKVAISRESVAITPTLSGWQHQGLGRMNYVADGQIRMCLPVNTGKRAQGPADDPDYATFGRSTISYNFHQRNLEHFNRISFEAFPQCEGVAIMNLNVFLNNEEKSDLGAHLVNLRNNQSVDMIADTVGISRVHLHRKMKDLTGQTPHDFIRNIRLELVSGSEEETGWSPIEGHIAHSFSGYFADGSKTAILRLPDAGKKELPDDGHPFQLVDVVSGETVYTDTLQTTTTTIGSFGVLDFSSFKKEGDYRLVCNGLSTVPFHIGDDVFVHAKKLLLNFIFCQRCGYEVEGVHGACHNDVFCTFENKHIPYSGGWHDAGDLSQQTLQTCETAGALLEAWQRTTDKRSDLASRLLDESMWGLRFVLRSRLGKGFHASSIGLLHWTDGIVGTADDIFTVRSQDTSYDNFLYAAYEAFAARVMPASALRDSLEQAAVEDFQFALDKFEHCGYDHFPHIMEHTYNTSPSLYHATMSWAASQLFMLTGNKRYGEIAVSSIGYAMECQEGEGVCPGYFYRDKTRKSIVHFIHQSREQLFMQALISLCESQPKHEEFGRWMRSIRLYANYLKGIFQYTAPYGMMPSGVYQTEEYADSAGFHALHIFAPPNAHLLYDEQLKKGARLDDNHFVRRFPIWFNIFNGNEAIILSTGKAAAMCGNFLRDDDLLQIGREQLYWTVGKNPFCQSLIYGEGSRYPSMDSFSSGEIMGEIPVGIRSWGNEDQPYWPHTNNACYKEVWVTSAAKFLSLLSEY